MTEQAKVMQKGRLMTVIGSTREKDASASAHTRGNALVTDLDRIDAARLAAERLADWLMIWGGWNVYVDSVGAVVSEVA